MILLVCYTSLVNATEVGTYGETYPIMEQDFLSFIQERLAKMQASGELKKWQEKAQARTRELVDRPHPVQNLSVTTEPRSWLWDPSITLPHDLSDAYGQVFAKKGSTWNPLNQVSLRKTLVFYDADDQEQVKWAQAIDKKLAGKTKLVLVKGSVGQEAKRFDKPIFFDQEGRLVARFKIQHTPALVSQEGLKLRIQEVKP